MKAKKILIVEDDKMLSTIYKMFLKDLGHELIGIYPDGYSAIEKCKQIQPDVVLMDILLQGEIDGIGTTKIIQENYDIPVIYVSGITDQQTVQRAIGTKSYGFIVKPVDKTELGIAIELAYTKHKYDNELKIREFRYRKLVHDSRDAVVLIVNNKIEYINYSGLKLFGTIHIEDMLGLDIADFIDETTLTEFTCRTESALASSNKITTFPLKFKTLNRSQFEANVNGSVINYKNQKAIQLIIDDITEVVESLNILNEQDNIIENIYDGIITLSLAGIIKYINKGAERIFGICREDALGKNINTLIKDIDDSYINEHLLEPALENDIHEIEVKFEQNITKEKSYVVLSMSSLKNTNRETTGIVCYCKDITKKKRIERQLKESEEKFKLLSLTSNDAYWDWDIKTDQMYFSPKFKELLGFKDREIRNSMEEWKARIEPSDSDLVSKALRDYLDGVVPFHTVEYRLLHKDETYHWYSERGLAIRDENGQATRMIGTITDITSQKEAKTIIKTSEANLKAIFNSNKEAIFLVDNEFKVLDLNKKAKQYLKSFFGKEFTPGNSIFDVLEFMSLVEIKDLFENTISASITHNLERNISVKGNEKHLEISIYPVLDENENEITRFCVSLFDVTDRIKIEKDLKETKAELRPLFDSSIQRFYLTDFDFKLVAFNKAAHETIKDDLGRILKKGDNILDFVPSEVGKELFIQRFHAARKGEHIVYKDQINTKVGKRWIETHIEPISNEKGEIIRILVWTLDITREKQAEEALIESQKKYYSLFSEANDAILLINDDNDKLVDCNDRAVELFEYSREEFDERKLIDLSADFQRDGTPSVDARKKRIDDVKSGGLNYTFSWCYKKKSGTVFDAEVSLSIVKLENINYRFAIVRDITDRLKMEKDLRVSEQRNKSLVQAIPDLIFIIDKDGVYKDFMADNEKVYHVPVDKIVGKNVTDYFKNQKLNEFQNSIKMAIQTKKLQKLEYELDSKIGVRWFEARITYLNDNEVLCLVRDIHEEKISK